MNVSEQGNLNSISNYSPTLKNEVRIAKPISEQEYFARNGLQNEKSSSKPEETSENREPFRRKVI